MTGSTDRRLEKVFLVTDTEVIVNPSSVRHGFLQHDKEFFYDFFSYKYNGQQIVISATDGENLKESGFYELFDHLCRQNIIPREKVLFKTFNVRFKENFSHSLLPMGLMWESPIPPGEFNSTADSAKFVGITVGRFTLPRFRMARELDREFGADAFIIFNPGIETCRRSFKVDFGYQDDLEWLRTRKFDIDDTVDYNSIFYSGTQRIQTLNENVIPQVLEGYYKLWQKFQIEVILETDALSDYWFTEKTSRCLSTGKPFLLQSGQHSLKRLQEIGFITFDKVINESYDNEAVPTRRIAKIIESLRELYNSPDKDQRIQQLYNIAKNNQKLYPKLKKLYKSYENTARR